MRFGPPIKGSSSATSRTIPYPKHHLATDDDLLRYLGDAIAVPSPIEQAISVGDILTYGGVGIVIVAAMRKPGRRQPDPVTDQEVAHAGG